MKTADAEIIKSLREGNIEAFGIAFHEYYPMLIVTAIKLVLDTETAVDMVQGVFLNIWEKRKQLEIRNSFHAYLHRSVRNACLNFLKQEKVKDRHHQNYTYRIAELSVAGTSYGPEEKFNEKELLDDMQAALQKLPDKCRNIFGLSRLSGKTNKEIAMLLNLSVRTVETQIYLALKILKKELIHHLS